MVHTTVKPSATSYYVNRMLPDLSLRRAQRRGFSHRARQRGFSLIELLIVIAIILIILSIALP